MAVVYLVASTVQPGHEQEWTRWQAEEHIPNLLALPGYRGMQRFQDAGGLSRFLNIWRIDERAAQQSDAYVAASLTEWFHRIRPFYDVSVEFAVEGAGPPTGADAPWRRDADALVIEEDASGDDDERAEATGDSRPWTDVAVPAAELRLLPLVEDGVSAPRSILAARTLSYLRADGSATAIRAATQRGLPVYRALAAYQASTGRSD